MRSVRRNAATILGGVGPTAWVAISDFEELLGRSLLIPLGGVVVGWMLDQLRSTNLQVRRILGLVDEEADIRKMSDNVRDLSERISQIEVSEFNTADTFFDALTRTLLETRESIMLTQIRSQTPDQMGSGEAGTRFNEALAQWLNAPNVERTAKRVMRLPNRTMIEWAKRQAGPGPLQHLRVRAVSGEEGVPNINFAVFDCKQVFVLLTADEANKYRGLGFSNRDVAWNFAEYFDLLWHEAEDLEVAIPRAEERLSLLHEGGAKAKAAVIDLATTNEEISRTAEG